MREKEKERKKERMGGEERSSRGAWHVRVCMSTRVQGAARRRCSMRSWSQALVSDRAPQCTDPGGPEPRGRARERTPFSPCPSTAAGEPTAGDRSMRRSLDTHDRTAAPIANGRLPLHLLAAQPGRPCDRRVEWVAAMGREPSQHGGCCSVVTNDQE